MGLPNFDAWSPSAEGEILVFGVSFCQAFSLRLRCQRKRRMKSCFVISACSPFRGYARNVGDSRETGKSNPADSKSAGTFLFCNRNKGLHLRRSAFLPRMPAEGANSQAPREQISLTPFLGRKDAPRKGFAKRGAVRGFRCLRAATGRLGAGSRPGHSPGPG